MFNLRFQSAVVPLVVSGISLGALPHASAQQPAITPPFASPAGVAPTPFTVEEAVDAAIRRNPRLSAAAYDRDAARFGVRSARALANPSLTFTPGLTGPGGSDEELLFQQPLELNGTRAARAGIARAELRRASAEAVVELRNLVAQTHGAYYELARARELREVSRDLLRAAEEFDRITRRQVEVGTRPGIDETQTGIEVTRARQQLTLAESQAASAEAALNTLLGRPAGDRIGPLPSLAAGTERGALAVTDREALLRQAEAARAEIAVQDAQREQFQQEARLARAQGRPDLAPQFRAGSVTRGFSDSGVGIGITLPFLDYGSRSNRIRQAEAAARAQEERVSAARNNVRQEVELAIARLAAAEAVIRDYRSGVLEQSRKLLEASRTGFQTGIYSVIQVLEAQRSYRAVQSEFIDALVSRAQARAELERATGAVPESRLPQPAEAARATKGETR